LNQLGGFVETEPVDVTGAQENIARRVHLTLPNGVSVLNANDVMLRVSIDPVVGGLTVNRPVTISTSCSVSTKVSPLVVQVILSGPLPILQTLKPDDVQIVATVTRCAVGSEQVELHPQNVPAKITVESIVPATTEVDVQSVLP